LAVFRIQLTVLHISTGGSLRPYFYWYLVLIFIVRILQETGGMEEQREIKGGTRKGRKEGGREMILGEREE
jgi:hypothetical protein